MTGNPRSSDGSLPHHGQRDTRHVIAGLAGFGCVGFVLMAAISAFGPTGATIVVIAIGAAAVIAAARVEFRPYFVTSLLCLILATWAIVTVLGLFFASVATAPLFGEEPSPSDIETGRIYLRLTFAAGAAITLPGLGLATWNRRAVWKVVFGSLLGVMALAALAALISG